MIKRKHASARTHTHSHPDPEPEPGSSILPNSISKHYQPDSFSIEGTKEELDACWNQKCPTRDEEVCYRLLKCFFRWIVDGAAAAGFPPAN